MNSFWVTIIRATGAVGVIAFLVYAMMKNIFSEKIVELFGGDRIFILSLIIISSLLIFLLIALLKPQKTLDKQTSPQGPKVTYKGKSTHNGDNNF